MDVALSSKRVPVSSDGSYKNHGALAIITTLFFMWGFCTVLNDALIPHLQLIFELSYLKGSFIQLAFFGSYFIFAMPAGRLVETVGYQRTMVLGLVSMAIGALLFLPAAATAKYSLFLAAQVVLAAGVTVLQVAANPYVTILGAPETASIRLNLTQAFNTLGDTIAPYLGSVLLLGGVESQASSIPGPVLTALRIREFDTVKMPYLSIAASLLILAVAVALYRFPHLDVTQDFHSVDVDMDRVSLWKHSHCG
jgi:MFS transporter, FHS family, L-fucose permease